MPTNNPLRSPEDVKHIVQSLLRQSTSVDRDRGKQYFKQRRVDNLVVDQRGLRAKAEVAGSAATPYSVLLTADPSCGSVDLSCDCPRFEDRRICKHVWAVLLELEHSLKNPGRLQNTSGSKKRPNRSNAPRPVWEDLLDDSRDRFQPDRNFSILHQPDSPLPSPQLHYVIDVSVKHMQLVLLEQFKNRSGQSQLQSFHLDDEAQNALAHPLDQEITCLLLGLQHSPYYPPPGEQAFELPTATTKSIWNLLVATGRFYWSLDPYGSSIHELYPIRQSEFDRPLRITPIISDARNKDGVSTMTVALKRDDKVLDNRHVVALDRDSRIALLTNEVTQVHNPEAIEFWIKAHSFGKPIEIRSEEQETFLKQLLTLSGIENVSLPDSWDVCQSNTTQPIPRLTILNHQSGPRTMNACVWFVYGQQVVRAGNPDVTVLNEHKKQLVTRNQTFEQDAIRVLDEYPLSIAYDRNGEQEIDFTFNKRNLLRIVDDLSELGWEVVLERSRVRRAGTIDVQVKSNVDWFDLAAKVEFEGQAISLPELLKAVKAKENFIRLADGSKGRLPDELIKKYARLAELGTVVDDSIRFRPAQAMLLDALLKAQENVAFDKTFKAVRKKLQDFDGVKSRDPNRSFQGTLRQYQREGLGWLHFLREFKFGGCLADDMGLGKTIQVLALLDMRRVRRAAKEKGELKTKKVTCKTKAAKSEATTSRFVAKVNQQPRKPSIVVVPKSLVFNWTDEASKFTPSLKILNYTGTDRLSRAIEAVESKGFDILLTTYGLLQKDIVELSKIDFDYAILDESQAIKNPRTLGAKACRLLRADHRLAMTGTPIENHLGELWSLFEFLNPGMLGSSAGFARLINQKKAGIRERKATAKVLAKGLEPFFLRRTKQQVLKELPEKTEQTLHCEMTPPQQKKYDELREFYRVKLAKKVETEGIGKSKIQVLEALLRLRQVACDPRLLDPDAKPGAKLELLQQQICEVVREGHRALIFSQFTSLLGLVRQQFMANGIQFEYLDGQTRNRQERVKRFQNDNSISAFLISIKAGGSGLNLTAADYVFLLDPWWNPAVEAQAIDRSHRIGQQKPVMAYRLISRGTVEEKIIELQQSKRDLAESVIRSDQSLLKSLTALDIQRLLG